MSSTTKPASNASAENVLRSAHNEVDSSLTVNGFLVGRVGHKVVPVLSTTTISDDTITYNFYDGSTLLYAIRMVFPAAQSLDFLSAERVS